MPEDYLFDPNSEPDPEVERLEQLLGRRRFDPDRIPLDPAAIEAALAAKPARDDSARRARRVRWIAATFAAAGIALVAGFYAIFGAGPGAARAGYLLVGVKGRSSLSVGEELVAAGNVTLEIGDLGTVELAPGARFAVRAAGAGEHRFFLERGELRAQILAPPRVFRIDTPAGDALDLGCAYTLRVDDSGVTHLQVTDGQVAFMLDGKEVYVPAGASCLSTRATGPAPPVFNVASAEFKRAVALAAGDPEPSEESLETILAADDRLYALTLFHLLDAPSERLRIGAFELLSKWYSKPLGVTASGVLAGDSEQLEAWRDEMLPSWRGVD